MGLGGPGLGRPPWVSSCSRSRRSTCFFLLCFFDVSGEAFVFCEAKRGCCYVINRLKTCEGGQQSSGAFSGSSSGSDNCSFVHHLGYRHNNISIFVSQSCFTHEEDH